VTTQTSQTKKKRKKKKNKTTRITTKPLSSYNESPVEVYHLPRLVFVLCVMGTLLTDKLKKD